MNASHAKRLCIPSHSRCFLFVSLWRLTSRLSLLSCKVPPNGMTDYRARNTRIQTCTRPRGDIQCSGHLTNRAPNNSLTLSSRDGADHRVAIGPLEWKNMVLECEYLISAMGSNKKKLQSNEKGTRITQRRGLWAAKNLFKGHTYNIARLTLCLNNKWIWVIQI